LTICIVSLERCGNPEVLHGSEGISLSLGGAGWREERWYTLDCCALRNLQERWYTLDFCELRNL